MYNDGFLPEPGGINAQPALLVEYFAQLKITHNRLDKEDMDRANSDNDGASGNAGEMKSILRKK